MKIVVAVTSVILALAGTAGAAEKPRTLNWESLLPEDDAMSLDQMAAQAVPLIDHSSMDAPPVQFGSFNVVDELDGELVRLPGYVLPFEYSESGKISEFLLVPYFGACIHVPPPPPNQMVYVKADAPVDVGNIWEAVWVVGVLRTQKYLNDVGDAAYTLELKSWEIYE